MPKISPPQQSVFVLSSQEVRTLLAKHLEGPTNFHEVIIRSWVYDDRSVFDLFLYNYPESSQQQMSEWLLAKPISVLEDEFLSLLLLELVNLDVLPEGTYIITIQDEPHS